MSEEEIRIGVYVCHCGINIGGVVDVPSVVEYASNLADVVIARESMFTCSSPGQLAIQEDIKNENLNRVVVAACSPHMHEVTFQKAVSVAGLNKHLLEIVNIREQVAWVHPKQPLQATDKAKRLVGMGVNKVRLLEPIEEQLASVVPRVLVIGGGVSGLRASIDMADRGYEVDLVEIKPTLGGHAARLGRLAHTDTTGNEVARKLVRRVMEHSSVTVYTNSQVVQADGAFGEYHVRIEQKPRYILPTITNPEKGEEICPESTSNEYDYGLTSRKAFYKPFEGSWPNQYVIDMETCTKCDKCVEACGSDNVDLNLSADYINKDYGTILVTTGFAPYIPEQGEYGYGQSDKIVTLSQFERIMADDTLYNKYVNGNTKNIVFIGCVGSMEDPSIEGARTYCSRICCSSSLKNMIALKEKIPDSNVFFLYRDVRTYARRDEHLYEDASAKMVVFTRFTPDRPPVVDVNGTMNVKVFDTIIQREIGINADLIVLANGMRASEKIDDLQETLKLPCGGEGFIQEAHAKLRPVEMPAPGLYVAGAAQSPRDIIESVTSGSAAAVKAVIPLIKGEVPLEPLQSKVNEEVCGGCRICISVCPYEAIDRVDAADETGRKVAHVNPRLCAGCGICTAACPSGAMQQFGFTDTQIYNMIRTIEVKNK